MQLRAVGLTEQALAAWRAAQQARRERYADMSMGAAPCVRPTGHGAGSGRADAPGGLRRQTPLADYDQSGALRVFVHLCSAAQWTAITGELPPRRRSTGDAYVDAGLPWFDYYDSDAEDLAPSGDPD